MNNFYINLCSIDPVDYIIANTLTPYFSICVMEITPARLILSSI